MAYIQAAALLTRLGEVLTDGLGAKRPITGSRFSGDFQEGLADNEIMRRGLAAPRVRADVMVMGRSKSSPPINGNLIIYDIQVTVTSVRTITRDEQVDETSNDTLVAAALVDMDAIRQALEYPGNLTTTAAAAATDLVSGMLSHISSSIGVALEIAGGAQKLESKHTFSGFLISRPSVA